MGPEQIRADGKEELFEAASVLETLAQEGDQFLGHVHAAAAFVLGEGENPGGMFVASGAGGAVFSDAGLFDQSQRSLERRPEGRELSQKLLLQERERIRMAFHIVCILSTIHTMSTKKVKNMNFYFCYEIPEILAVTDALRLVKPFHLVLSF